MKILFIADIVGRPGRRVVEALLPGLLKNQRPDVVVANGENLAAGYGVTPALVADLLAQGVDVITSGNHIWDRQDGVALLDGQPRLLRPANYPPGNPGQGSYLMSVGQHKVGIVNLQGRAFMSDIDDPFRVGQTVVDELSAETNVVVVDFHAEATAEKQAFARFIDGRVSAVIGTHTHVPTADARVLPGGTAFVTDAGMTGAHGGVIGFRADKAIQRAMLGRRVRLGLADGDLRFQGAILDVDPGSGHALWIERIDLAYEEER
ncbi:MAG: TIGR00282 family metallophosphoesterase [Gemmatimonadales bacterium]|jgi:metallophosphoesterase (TIGR00282 family)